MRSIRTVGRLSTIGVGLAVLAAAYVLLPAVPASAKPSPSAAYTLFGDAVLVNPGYNSPTAAQASYNGDPTSPSFGGVDFGAPAGMTLSQLVNLSSEYQFTVGTCSGGAPRFQVFVSNGVTSGNVFFYFGPPPEYTTCPDNIWENTGNLADPSNLVDDSQLGGTFYDTYANAVATFGSYTVEDISVVVDGYSVNPITAQFDNVQINDTTYTFENMNSCKDGGWQLFTTSPGPFKNQGDCVSYFATGGRNS